MKIATRKVPHKSFFLHPMSLAYLNTLKAAEGSIERESQKTVMQATQILEHYEEQVFLHQDEATMAFYDSDGFRI